MTEQVNRGDAAEILLRAQKVGAVAEALSGSGLDMDSAWALKRAVADLYGRLNRYLLEAHAATVPAQPVHTRPMLGLQARRV